MDLFTLKHSGKKYRMALTSLRPARNGAKIDPKNYHVCCDAHKREEKSGPMAFKGLALEGTVPVKELVRWARRKGFLKWTRKGGSNHVRNAHRGTAASVPATPSVGGERKAAG